MTISKSWFSYLVRAFALSLCTALLLNFVSCSDSSTSQEPKVKIILDANGGSFSGTTETTQTLLIKKNQTSKLSTADELDLTFSNHNFKGWAKSQQGTVEFDDGADITSSTDLTLYAQWEVVNSTYTVKHLLQNLADDSYTEDEEATEQNTGTYGTQTAAAPKTYEGFTAHPIEQKTIQDDGSTVVEIYYDRNSYTISYSSTYGEPPTAKPVKYGYVLETEDIPDLSETNYSFKGWYADGISIAEGYIVKKDITLTAQWRSQTGFILTFMTGTDIIITEDSNTFTATPSVAGTYTYAWYINEVQQSSTTNTFTLDTTGMAPGYYTLVVTAVSDSIESTSCYQITVTGE